MKMQKTAAILLGAVMIMSFAACNNGSGGSSTGSSLPEGTPNTAGTPPETSQSTSESEPAVSENPSTPDVPDFDPTATTQTYSDENVTLELTLDREAYTVNDMIGLTVTITNNAARPIIFVKGSGSNSVPDALTVSFSDFVNTYTPLIATMDYQTETLESGESVTYELPYAPYTVVGEPEEHPFGADIEFFQNENYTPAAAGGTGGEVIFKYLVVTDDMPMMPDFDGEDVKTIQGAFETSITE